MTAEHRSVDEVFSEAIKRPSGQQREKYLDDACGDDLELRERIERLLCAFSEAGSFLESPAEDPSPTIDRPITEKAGTQIGPYKLLQQLGEGGMGVVYMAEQKEPVKRRVALKIIKPGMDTRQVIARFEAERQALAMMDHPNIAKVLDAGATESGRPYFVMELVNGISITQYCDQQHLTPKERLELFVPICQAVQHAHQKGIIHRDLKPSNILVASYDDKAFPKIIDFGVAKATSQTLTEKTMYTQLGQVVGTLEYMSPEQAERSQLDIDTRSDIYSLGVVLYELLTGETPFDRQRLRSAAFDEMLRIIREEEPPKPSTKLSSSQSLPSIAANRRIEPARLGSTIRGELDWIVMKALEKDRARRYESASSFAADVQHYLNNEAVTACPPSAAYRFRKFARRNKTALGVTAAVAAALIVGIIGTTWQAIRAMKAERKALAEAKRADQEAEIATAVTDFLNKDLLLQADPDEEPDRDIKLRTLLDRAAETIEERFAEQPLVKAAIERILGDTYSRLGEFKKAEMLLRRSLDVRKAKLGPEHPKTIGTVNELASVLHDQWQYEEAEQLYRENLAIVQRIRGPEHLDTLGARHNLVNLLMMQGRYSEAEKTFRDIIEIAEPKYGPEHQLVLTNKSNLARTLTNLGEYKKAEQLLGDVVDISQRLLGKEHPKVLVSRGQLASTLKRQHRYREAENILREVVETQQRVLGKEHHHTHASIRSLASVLAAQRQYKEAETLIREVLQIEQSVYGEEHPETLFSRFALASVTEGQKQYQEAESLIREALEIRQRVLGKENINTLSGTRILVHFLRRQKRHREAENLIRELLEIQQRVLGQEHRLILASRHDLAQTLLDQGRHEDAEKLFRELLPIQQRVLGKEHLDTLVALGNLGVALHRQKRYAEAEKLYSELVEIQDRVLDRKDHRNLLGRLNLAQAIIAQGKVEEAKKAFLDFLENSDRVLGPNHHDTLNRKRDLKKAFLAASWELSTASELGRRDPQRAADLAQAVIDLDANDPDAWSILGVARCRLEDWRAAEEALGHGYKLRKKTDPMYQFVLAMTHWRLDHQEKALNNYLEAVEWLEAGRRAAVQHGFRKEAEALIPAQAIVDFCTTKLAEEPTSNQLYRQRGAAHARSEDYQAAAEDFLRARDLAGDTEWKERTPVFRTMMRYPPVFDQLAELQSDDSKQLWLARGRYHARCGRWEEASADYARSLGPPRAHSLFIEKAYLLLLAGDIDGYRDLCQRLVDEFGASEDTYQAQCLAVICALNARSGVEPEQIVGWAEQAVAANRNKFTLNVLAMACYRGGDYERTIESLRESIDKYKGHKSNLAALLALAHARLGQKEKCRTWYDRAERHFQNFNPSNPDKLVGLALGHWLNMAWWHREAVAALGNMPDDDQSAQQRTSPATKTADENEEK